MPKNSKLNLMVISINLCENGFRKTLYVYIDFLKGEIYCRVSLILCEKVVESTKNY